METARCSGREQYEPLLSPPRMLECRQLSGLREAIGHRQSRRGSFTTGRRVGRVEHSGHPEDAAATAMAAAGGSAVAMAALATEVSASAGRAFRRCAVVGSSGSLLWEEAGREIDEHDLVIRLNRAPVAGFEAHVGSFTSARLVNAPQSMEWAKELQAAAVAGEAPQLPSGVAAGEALLLSSGESGWVSVSPHLVSVARLNRTYRRRCVLPLFSDHDRAAHTQRHHNQLTPTFGFEAIAHALHACDHVTAYGFFIPPEELARPQGAGSPPAGHAAAATATTDYADAAQVTKPPKPFRYHYWEERTHDAAADQPSKPWTYKSHNYEIESARLRHMADEGCVLTLKLPVSARSHTP